LGAFAAITGKLACLANSTSGR
ncbi:hypothetical protein D049_1976B, partial [Vibrio parahaemolyticus VPTS-2010]